MIGDFRTPDLHYQGWLEKVKESKNLSITEPSDRETFLTQKGQSKKEIRVSGVVTTKIQGKVLVIIRTDRDYPQALGILRADGTWSFSGCTLGGVDHQIYATMVGKDDTPIFRSKIVTVRLERR